MSNEITRYQPGSVDINRRGGQLGNNAGGSGGGQHGEAHESAQVTQLRSKIAAITKLAHTGKERDERAYVARQGELRGLMEQLVQAQGGAVATTGDAPISDPSQLKNLPRNSQWRDAWADSKAELADVGITPAQAEMLGQIVLRRELESRQAVEAAIQQRRSDSERALANAYGSRWRDEVRRGNDYAKTMLPDGAAKQLFAERLADGSVLGDHVLIAKLMIELARQ